jgi:carbon-monoxide dehydrogenase small subunit
VTEYANGTTRLSESFLLPHPLRVVWALMGDVESLARSMPGMSLEGPPQAGAVKGRFSITIGPITASFSGEGRVQRIGEFRQSIAASGGDHKSGSRVRGSVDYALSPVAEENSGEQTRVDVAMTYVLTGPLAQIGRSAIVRDLARRIGEAFAHNLDARLRQQEAPLHQAPLAGGRLMLALIADRLRALVAALFKPRP